MDLNLKLATSIDIKSLTDSTSLNLGMKDIIFVFTCRRMQLCKKEKKIVV